MDGAYEHYCFPSLVLPEGNVLSHGTDLRKTVGKNLAVTNPFEAA